MRKYLLSIMLAFIGCGIVRGEVQSVQLYTSVNGTIIKDAEPYISQTVGGTNYRSLNEIWDTGAGGIRPNKSGTNAVAWITFKSPEYTIISRYSFLVSVNYNGPEILGTVYKDNYYYQINDGSKKALYNGTQKYKESNESYEKREIKVATKSVRVGIVSYSYYYHTLNDFNFRVQIPEVVAGQTMTTTALERLTNDDLSNNITSRSGYVYFQVKDPIDTSNPNNYFSADFSSGATKTGDSWTIGTTGWTCEDKSTYYLVGVPVTYKAASTPTKGNFEATIRLDSRNSINDNYAEQKITIAVGVLEENPVDWGYNDWTNGGDATIFKGATYSRSKYLINTDGMMLSIPVSSNPSVIAVNQATGELTAKEEGTTTITYTQPATTKYKEKVLTLHVTVTKQTPAFTINAESKEGDTHILYVNKDYRPLFETTNTNTDDYPVKVTVIDESGNEMDDSQYITFEGLDATVLANTQTIRVKVTQQEGNPEGEDLWFSHTEEYIIEIRHNPIHVGNLCDVSLKELWSNKDFVYKTELASFEDSRSCVVVGGTAGSTTGGYVIFHFEGTPDKLTLGKYASNSGWTWSIQQSNTPNDEGFHDLNSGDTFDADARYLKIAISGDKANGEIRSLCITEKAGIDASPKEVSLAPVQDASGNIINISMGQFSVTPYNLEKAKMTITGANASDFELVCGSHKYEASLGITLDAADGLGVDRNPTVSVHVRYVGSDLTNAIGKTATVHIQDLDNIHSVDLVLKVIEPIRMNEYGVPNSICAGMATTTGIETGTEHATNNAHPYRRKTSVDLTGAFIGGAAYFDELYIFGVTKGYTKDGTSTMSVGRYSKTPCYVYVKNGNCYTFSRCVENMNSETKNIGIGITASGQKLYFTGWCPYASTGRVSSDNGVFHITGGAGAKVDIYLDECYMYARSKLIREDQDANYAQTDNVASTSFGDYPTGSGGVFVLQTSSTSAGNPFQPAIHLRRNNVLQSTTGSYVQVSAMGVTKNATQCSSPVHMYTTGTDQYETLTIDDKWPAGTTSSTSNTNGTLQLRKTTNGSPSIDLGNEHSVVNINGGQITLSNSVPQSASYSSTMALSWRKYSQSVLGINVTIYGIGNDQASGTVNFNDGTISAVPIDKNSTMWKTYQSYYWDNVSLKCPQNTHVNGGSYNCNIYVCKSYDDKGASPTDKRGTALCKWDIKTTGTKENGTAIYTFPENIKLSDNVNYNSLGEYYTRNGFEYGRSSVTADEAGKVNLLLPCGYVGKEPQEGVTIVSWAMCLPSLQGQALSKTYPLGGDIDVVSDKKNEISYLLWVEVDENIREAVKGYKTPPFIEGNDQSTGTVTFADNSNYKSITNTTSYAINQELRIIKPAVADVWMTFTAPFNVQAMYVLESYPDSVLQQKSRNEALQLQAQANLDYSFYLVSEVKVPNEPSSSPYSTFYNSWLQYEYGQDTTGTNPVYPAEGRTVKGKDGNMYYPRSAPRDYIQNYRGQRELVAYDGANWDKANFYLYESVTDTWPIVEEEVAPKQWKVAEPTEDGTLLQQGHTYTMLFPYCTGCWTDEERNNGVRNEMWDYWSGKLLVFEGAGPATIAGSNYHTSLLNASPSIGEVAILGNATLAKLTTNSGSVWTYQPSPVGSEGFVQNDEAVDQNIKPTEAFLIGEIPASVGKIARRINMLTGKVEYEDNTPTGVPTINGGSSLFITPTDNGIRIETNTPQSVRIYSSSGALVFDRHIGTYIEVALHTAGIYVVRGEQEVQKIMVH